MTQTRFEQATDSAEAIILTLGLAATMQQTREQLAEEAPERSAELIDTMLQSVAASLGAMGIVGEA